MATIVKEGTFHSGSFPLKIGRYNGRMPAFHGAVEETKLWSRPLTEEEIERASRSAKGRR